MTMGMTVKDVEQVKLTTRKKYFLFGPRIFVVSFQHSMQMTRSRFYFDQEDRAVLFFKKMCDVAMNSRFSTATITTSDLDAELTKRLIEKI